jgi:hypothetical protein
MAAGLLVLLGLAAFAAYLITGGGGHTLTVVKPTGGTLRGSGITCGTDGSSCTLSVDAGAVVELTATPDDGFSFAGFTGDCAPVGRVLMGGPRSCGASFEQGNETVGRTWPLTITPASGGTILSDAGHQCGGTHTACTVSVPEGQTVKIEGYTDPGFSVAAYTGDCAPQGTTVMSQARTCSATFVQFKVAGPQTTLPEPQSNAGLRPQIVDPRATGPRVADTGVVRPPPGDPKASNPPPATTTTPAAVGNTTTTPANTGPANTGGAVGEPPPAKDGDGGARERAVKIAQGEVLKTLQAYRQAYLRMDIDAMRRLHPSLQVARHQFEFSNVKSVKYDFEGDPAVQPDDIDTAIGRATVVVGVKTENTPKAGKKQKPVEWQATFTLKRIGESATWIIETLDNRPK